jgi:hypothetical protein
MDERIRKQLLRVYSWHMEKVKTHGFSILSETIEEGKYRCTTMGLRIQGLPDVSLEYKGKETDAEKYLSRVITKWTRTDPPKSNICLGEGDCVILTEIPSGEQFRYQYTLRELERFYSLCYADAKTLASSRLYRVEPVPLRLNFTSD